MVLSYNEGIETEWEAESLTFGRCVNCGNLLEARVLANRQRGQRPGRRGAVTLGSRDNRTAR